MGLAGILPDDPGRLLDLGDRLRGEEDKDAVDARVREDGADGDVVSVGFGVADDVDRVVDRGGDREVRAKLGDRLRGEGASVRPAFSAASVAMMPGPPAFVTMAMRLPSGSGCIAKALAKSNSSLTDEVRIAPVCLNAAT